jgi:hypothetical protein
VAAEWWLLLFDGTALHTTLLFSRRDWGINNIYSKSGRVIEISIPAGLIERDLEFYVSLESGIFRHCLCQV